MSSMIISALRLVSSVLSISFSLDFFVLLSLLFQYVLLMVAPWRKNSSARVYPMVWIVYLQGIGIAEYVMGSIPNYNSIGGRTGDLRVFWAAFVILYYGSPNTITGVSLKDNDLWLRSLGRFFTLSYSFGLVIYRRSFQKNHLWWPTACIFLVAALRFLEKVMCRFLARLTKFQESTLPSPDPGVDYAKLMEMYAAGVVTPVFDDAPAPAPAPERLDTNHNSNNLTQVEIVRKAFKLFHEFQGLFVNSVYSYDQRHKTRSYFLGGNVKAEQAFSICEIELNLAYDVFYTKSILIHRFKLFPAVVISLACFILELTSLLLWILVDKHTFHKPSVLATYIMLLGYITLDVLSLLMFLTSDWGIAKLQHKSIILSSFYEILLTRRRLCFLSSVFGVPRSLLRWSEIIHQLDLLRDSLSTRIRPSVHPAKRLTGELRSFLFKELVARSHSAENPDDVEELCSARGSWVLDLFSRNCQGWSDVADTFQPWISDVEFEESLILWHIATTLCYYNTDKDDDQLRLRELCKIISDYMLHLLMRQPQLMPPSAVVPARIIFNDTCAEARRFLSRAIAPLRVLPPWPTPSQRLPKACEKIIQVDTEVVPPREIRGDESKALLFDACHLAKTLRKVAKEKRVSEWEIISKVLAELLFYSAAHSSPAEHLEKLQTGGELLTLVWLLMAHLGLGNHFRQRNNGRDTRAEFVIAKH